MTSPPTGDGSAGDASQSDAAPSDTAQSDAAQSLAGLARSQTLAPAAIARILGEIAGALDEAASRGNLYRAVRPENILIGAGGRATLADPPVEVTDQGSLDAVVFASPEQLRDLPLDPQSDQYSLAATAFALLTGTPPYTGSSTAVVLAHGQDPVPSACARNPHLPPAVDPVLRRALAKNPADRFPDSRSFAAALLVAIDGTPVAATVAPAHPADKPARRRSKVLLLVGALVVVVAVVAGVTAFVLTRSGGGSGKAAAAAPARALVSGSLTTICAARTGGQLACTDDNDKPVAIGTLKSVSSLDASATPCAIAGGQVYCWGSNSSGQFGTGITSDNSRTQVPQAIPGMTQATVVAGNGGSPCAINAGDVYCWGDLTTWYPVMTGPQAAKPTKIPGLTGATDLSASWSTGCAVIDHAAWCWGRNQRGQAGDPTGGERIRPTKVAGLGNVTKIRTQSWVTCAISDSEPYCWGNIAGLVGDKLSETSSYPRPTKIAGFGQIADLSVGSNAIQGDPIPGTRYIETVGSPVLCAITTNATVKCAGDNNAGQLGTGDTSRSGLPVDIKGVTGATAIAVDSYGIYACAMTEDLVCWGRPWGDYGQPDLPRARDWPR